ncbi:hypothetical protein [Maritimibacter sp. DP1N21-5]|uniref:hypothetical protein n=1 Tax=Maritimibacter sp. DP1N21-5 TaxID=2836867 RepID=UPI001C460E99|nr:hypothetical protein [Maritimibacter sp. DP1N21-5]MBV7408175.1 hypothetical protein [Maritimibacter sp. DP1N21-5]
MTLLDISTITLQIAVTEDELRDRLISEALSGLGLNRDHPTITQTKVLRGEGGRGGYRVLITRDMRLDTTPRIEDRRT